eukprot:3751682-Rhodomonas_salina.6
MTLRTTQRNGLGRHKFRQIEFRRNTTRRENGLECGEFRRYETQWGTVDVFVPRTGCCPRLRLSLDPAPEGKNRSQDIASQHRPAPQHPSTPCNTPQYPSTARRKEPTEWQATFGETEPSVLNPDP